MPGGSYNQEAPRGDQSIKKGDLFDIKGLALNPTSFRIVGFAQKVTNFEGSPEEQYLDPWVQVFWTCQGGAHLEAW